MTGAVSGKMGRIMKRVAFGTISNRATNKDKYKVLRLVGKSKRAKKKSWLGNSTATKNQHLSGTAMH